MSSLRIATAADLREVMRADFTMSEQQWHAISASLEPGVVIAGAGSGKTELMAARVIYLVANGFVQPDQVLGLTFTAKAAGELAERIRGALTRAGLDVSSDDGERLEPMVSTYHSYAALLLREHGLRIGHEPDLRVMADAGRYQLAARAVARHTGHVRELSEHPPTAIQGLLALESQLSEHLAAPDDVRAFQAQVRPRFVEALATARLKKEQDAIGVALKKLDEREELLDLIDGYRRLKQSYGLVDFSDQIALACELAEGHPDVGAAEREKYQVVLLDEYQDTSVAQARLLSALFSGPTPEAGRGHAVTGVGDPNQAIYGWRGASVSNILRFGSFFPAVDGGAVPSYPLTVNRRSDVRILDVATALARPLYEHPASKQAGVLPLEAKPGALDGEVRTIVHPTYAAELGWLTGQVQAAHERFGSWKEIGVLVRTNRHAADVYDALNAAGVPVEIVGLGGLLRLPEVAGVVATLTLLQDLTANDSLLTLLTGPRWAIGPRDLALLGKRARDLAAGPGRQDEKPLADALRGAVGGSDPTEVVSLMDALDDPGEPAYSDEARHRFGLLSAELRRLRVHAGEPLLDLVRRIIDTTGVDVELASSLSPAAPARRENLELFVRAVADFQAVDGQVTLPALLAWLSAEDEFEQGLDAATPSEADSVKLLTIHRAKGLEYDAVFLVGVVAGAFPATRLRSQWTRSGSELPIPLRGDCDDLPALPSCDFAGLEAQAARAREHQEIEEARLGYVAFTRARHLMWVSSYVWGPTQTKPFGPSPYQELTAARMESWGAQPDGWHEPEPGETNPALGQVVDVAWPATAPTPESRRRAEAATLVRATPPDTPDPELSPAEAAVVARWDDEIDRLVEEARRSTAPVVEVPLPPTLSATALARLHEDAAVFARELARPMPRPPSSAARFGTRFHAWVEARFGQQALLDPDDLPGQGDRGIDDDTDLQQVIAAFESGPFALRRPHAVEAPFALVLGGQVVRGRIDAVYAEPGEHLGDPDRYLVVDWKTSRSQTADPLQLAIYRVAWAELMGVPVDSVTAAFHYVRTGQTVVPDDLPGRAELEALVTT